MYSMRKIWIVLSVFLFCGLFFQNAIANSSHETIPPDFSLISSDTGVELFRKDYQGGNPDFVQIVDLQKGASINLLHGNIVEPGTGLGVYGGDNPSLRRQSLEEVWQNFISTNSNAFCITNGQFFVDRIDGQVVDPTTLAFPLKKDGIYISDGYAINEYQNQKLILEIWEDKVDIVPLTKESLYESSAPNIIAGLTENADKGMKTLTGRTFVGIEDNNNDDIYEVVLIFNSKTSTQEDAANILRSFGADKIIMLDGGGSTQLMCDDNHYIDSSRTIPQTIVVLSKKPPALLATVINQPFWPILIEGERLNVDVELQNSGSDIWTTDRFQLVNKKNPWGVNENLSLSIEVKPKENTTFTWITNEFSKWGVYTTEWYMAKDGETFPERLKFSVIVLPKKLEEKKDELEENIKEWSEEQLENIEQLVIKWIRDQLCKNPLLIIVPTLWFIRLPKRKP